MKQLQLSRSQSIPCGTLTFDLGAFRRAAAAGRAAAAAATLHTFSSWWFTGLYRYTSSLASEKSSRVPGAFGTILAMRPPPPSTCVKSLMRACVSRCTTCRWPRSVP